MLSAHITSFLKLIDTQLEETSRGVTSSHHFHNVQCGIENILSLLDYNNELVDRADQLSRRAFNYITRHDLISSKISDRDQRGCRSPARYSRSGCRFPPRGRAQSAELQGSHTRTGLKSLSTRTPVTKSRSLSVPGFDACAADAAASSDSLRDEHRPTTTSRQR